MRVKLLAYGTTEPLMWLEVTAD